MGLKEHFCFESQLGRLHNEIDFGVIIYFLKFERYSYNGGILKQNANLLSNFLTYGKLTQIKD